jgi:hypothetical protein
MMRLIAWAAGLLVFVGAFAVSVLTGSSLLVYAVALACVVFLTVRIGVLNGPAELRMRAQSAAAALAGAVQRRWPSVDAALSDVDVVSTPVNQAPGISIAAIFQRTFAAATEIPAGALTTQQKWSVVAVLAAFGIPLALRAYRLEGFQAEVYGDINIVFEYMRDVLKGAWPFSFILSSGPLYHYLITPVVAVAGLSYFGLKMASALVSMGVLYFAYRLGREVVDHSFGLLFAFVAGVSSWLLVFSRLGNSQIVVPLLTTASLWAAARFLRRGRTVDLVACAVIGALGLYGYPQSFVIAPTMFVTLLVMKFFGHAVSWRALGIFIVAAAVVALPFALVLAEDSGNLTGGYIFDKIVGAEQPLQNLFSNLLRSLSAFHIKGDDVFRSNPSGMPHLDGFSGIFMLAGLGFWLRRDVRRWFLFFFLPFLLLQAPALLVVNFTSEVPSASRTLGVALIVYLWVATGVWWVATELRRRIARASLAASAAFCVVALTVVTQANIERYFVDYGRGLPYDNTAVARTAVDYIDTLPVQTNVYLWRCCWEGGMPEPKSIQFEMREPHQLVEITDPALTCEMLDSLITRPAVLLWSFHDVLPDPGVQTCMNRLPSQLHVAPNGRPVFYSAVVQP